MVRSKQKDRKNAVLLFCLKCRNSWDATIPNYINYPANCITAKIPACLPLWLETAIFQGNNLNFTTALTKNNLSIQIKAALLLLVFGLNTVIGFACAVGMDMGFNTAHHKKESEAIKVHIHADGKKHQHPDKSANHHHEENKKDSKEKGGCCNDPVVKFSQTDKSLPQSVAVISPVFFTAFITSFYITEIFYPSQAKVSVKYFVRGHHPPIPDIRVAIQSFQI